MSTYNMEKQHKLGKLHALERICMLLDECNLLRSMDISRNTEHYELRRCF